jgi:signal transduction histidine kinase
MNAFGRLRDVTRRHEHLADATIALAVLAATAATTLTERPPAAGGNRLAAVACAAVACAALAMRRTRPLVTLAVSAGAAEAFLAQSGASSAGGGTARGVLILLAPCIALYTVADVVERRRGLIAGGAALAALALVHALMHPGMIGPENLALTALGGLAIAAGDSSRNRRAYLAEVERRAERAERDREQDARQRVADERLRIARDLHDSVGHHLALISVQSDVAGRAAGSDAAQARQALAHVKSASRKALEELRDTVSLLRQPGEAVAPTCVPAAGLEELDDLLLSLRAAGLAIDCLVKGTAVALAPAADRTAYRVIQESLTNVSKHSRRRQARLTIGYDRQDLRITVDDLGAAPGDPGGDAAAGRDGAAGHGIAGMRERVLAIGGQFSAGPRPGGAFQVRATLPYQPRPCLGGAPQGRP